MIMVSPLLLAALPPLALRQRVGLLGRRSFGLFMILIEGRRASGGVLDSVLFCAVSARSQRAWRRSSLVVLRTVGTSFSLLAHLSFAIML